MLRVIHVLRAPVGGLFRHVRDLVAAQSATGLSVGVVCDSRSADALTADRLAGLAPHLALGLHQTAMSRDLGPADVSAFLAVRELAARLGADILHGHGAKGGAYARLAAAALRARRHSIAAFYTPHGGSLHYHPSSILGRIFMGMERRLAGMTDGLIFESAYSERVYRANVCAPASAVRVIPNGLLPAEFEAQAPALDAADVLFVGELRKLKGVDVLIEALAAVRTKRPVRAMIVGDGPDAASFRDSVVRLGLQDCVAFPGAMPARAAFPRGRIIVVPSRAESFPYIVLEAAAAGIPLIATDVGGIPEIVAGTDTSLTPAGDVAALSSAILDAIEAPAAAAERAARLQASVAARFTVQRMAAEITDFYCAVTPR